MMHLPITGIVSGGAVARAVVSVEHVTVSFASTDVTQTVNLTMGQDESQCVPFASARNSATLSTFSQLDLTQIGVSVEVYNNGGTAALRLQRITHGSRSIVVKVEVVEFSSGVTVQRGTSSYTTLLTGTASITAVDLSKAFLVFTARGSASASRAPKDAFVRGQFNSTTQLGFDRNNDVSAPADDVTVWYYVVEDTDGALFDVQTVSISQGSGVTTTNTTISSVDMSASIVVASANGAAASAGLNSEGYSYLQSATNVRTIRTNSTTNTDDHVAYVIEFLDGTTVQRGIRTTNTGTAGDADRSETVAITTVDTTKSIAKWTECSRTVRSGRNVIYNGSNVHSLEITAGGASITIAYRGSGTASEVEAAWEVVTFNT